MNAFSVHRSSRNVWGIKIYEKTFKLLLRAARLEFRATVPVEIKNENSETAMHYIYQTYGRTHVCVIEDHVVRHGRIGMRQLNIYQIKAL